MTLRVLQQVGRVVLGGVLVAGLAGGAAAFGQADAAQQQQVATGKATWVPAVKHSLLVERSADDAAIRKMIADQAAAWNAGDAHGYAADFSENGAYVNVRGERFVGRAEFQRRHAEIFHGYLHGSHQDLTVDSLTWLGLNAAYAEVATAVTGFKALPAGGSPKDGVLRTHALEIFEKRDARWWIVAYYNVNEAAPASKTTPAE